MITPGPWEMVDDDGWTMIYSAAFDGDGDRIPVADLYHGGYDFADLGYPLKDNAFAISLVPEMIEALESIAVRSDTYANEYLERTGSYAMFDEPASVETARTILSKLEGKTDE